MAAGGVHSGGLAMTKRRNEGKAADPAARVTPEGGALERAAPSGAPEPATGDDDDDDKPAERKKKKPGDDNETRKGGSFWSTPWPYVIGGVALAGAGAAVYFGTRPSDAVSVGPVNVGTR